MIHSAPALLPVLAALAQPQFVATEIASYPGSPRGLNNYYALALGPSGAVAGSVFPRGVLWQPSGTSVLPTFGGPITIAAALNTSTFATGWSTTAAGEPHVFFYNHSGFADLGTLGGRGSWGYAINDNAQIVGESDTPATSHAFLWSYGIMTDLGSLPDRPHSAAVAINNAGRIAGNAWNAETDSRAFVYADGQMTDLGLPPWAGAGDWVTAFDINASGVIAGATGDPDDPASDRGFLYHDGHWTNLGLVHGLSTVAAAVNDGGVAVGYSDHAFLYSAGTRYDLTALGIPGIRGVLDAALDINNAGQILAHSLEVSTTGILGHYYVLTPVPAPASLAIVLGAIPLRHRRRR